METFASIMDIVYSGLFAAGEIVLCICAAALITVAIDGARRRRLHRRRKDAVRRLFGDRRRRLQCWDSNTLFPAGLPFEKISA